MMAVHATVPNMPRVYMEFSPLLDDTMSAR
jgi:hypothetical protein